MTHNPDPRNLNGRSAPLQAAIARGGATKGQLQQLVLDIATASRGLVKAQMTWFRDEEMFR